MYHTLKRGAGLLARAMAYFGGALLILIVVLTGASIIGRALIPLNIGLGPIKGIYDYTEIGMAAAVFAFLPLCQFNRGHAVVDLFKPAFPVKMNQLLDLVFDIAMTAAAIIGAWRLYLGMLDKMRYGETTLIAQVPVWQGFALSLIGACAFGLVAAFCVIRSLRVLMNKETEDSAYV